jgi:hypothetical protein
MPVPRALLCATTAILLAGTLGVRPAAAQGRPEVSHDPPSTVTVLLGDLCEGFDVRADVIFGQNNVVTFDNGTVLSTGSVRARITRILPNGSDGASIALNISGQGRLDVNTGLVSAHGPWELDHPDDPTTPEWEGKFLFVNGNTVFDPATADVISSTTPVRDLCAELA